MYTYTGSTPTIRLDLNGEFTFTELAISALIVGALAGIGQFYAIRTYTNGKASVSHSLKVSIAAALVAALLTALIMSGLIAPILAASSQAAILGGVTTSQAFVASIPWWRVIVDAIGFALISIILEGILNNYHFYRYYNSSRAPTIQEKRRINAAIILVNEYNSKAGGKLSEMMERGDIKVIDEFEHFAIAHQSDKKIGLADDSLDPTVLGVEFLASLLYHEYFHTLQGHPIKSTGPFGLLITALFTETEPYAEQFEFGKSTGLWARPVSSQENVMRHMVLESQRSLGTIHKNDEIVVEYLNSLKKKEEE